MDRISGLSDDLLVKILWFLETKDAVSTSILSKRWKFLWMWLPKLAYYTTSMSESKMLRCFLNRTLPLHKAPVIERFSLDITHSLRNPEDIKIWVEAAFSRHVRELVITKDYVGKEDMLPSSLYDCKSLTSLTLGGGIEVVVPPVACLPSLKTLLLHNLFDVDGLSFRKLVSISPALENLSVRFKHDVTRGNISVNLPLLRRLSISPADQQERIEIDTPSLEYLKIEDPDEKWMHHYSFKNMPKLEEAYVDVMFRDIIKNLIRSITSVKRLTLCCPEAVYGGRFVFKHLVHLKLCGCAGGSSNLLAWLLRDSPNLRKLDIFQIEGHVNSSEVSWNRPRTVPECFLSSLESFSWSKYMGRPRDRDLVVYILQNACRLKTATISSSEPSITKKFQMSSEYLITQKFQMMKELSSSPRASTTCRLLFD